jgi:hypothetical protein
MFNGGDSDSKTVSDAFVRVTFFTIAFECKHCTFGGGGGE